MSFERFLIPPYLLRHLADASDVSDHARELARQALSHFERIAAHQVAEFERHGITAFLRNLESEDYPKDQDTPKDQETLKDQDHDDSNHKDDHDDPKDQDGDKDQNDPKEQGGMALREIYDMTNSESESDLPGKLVLKEGPDTDATSSDDKAVNDVFEHVGRVLALFKDKFNWTGVDGSAENATAIVSSVHFGKEYENACMAFLQALPQPPDLTTIDWDPRRKQFVFGDGGEFLGNFTGAVDVIGHELTHGVTDHLSPLVYMGMSGALNEHISDVFGIMAKQIVEDETAEDADWLIGEACIMPGVKGTALRSMKAPGTAYDDPRFVSLPL